MNGILRNIFPVSIAKFRKYFGHNYIYDLGERIKVAAKNNDADAIKSIAKEAKEAIIAVDNDTELILLEIDSFVCHIIGTYSTDPTITDKFERVIDLFSSACGVYNLPIMEYMVKVHKIDINKYTFSYYYDVYQFVFHNNEMNSLKFLYSKGLLNYFPGYVDEWIRDFNSTNEFIHFFVQLGFSTLFDHGKQGPSYCKSLDCSEFFMKIRRSYWKFLWDKRLQSTKLIMKNNFIH